VPRTGEQTIAAGELLLGKYRVEEVIGRGGMGLVVRAVHVGLDEMVAIKLLRDDVAIDEETIARFLREAQAAVKLKSEHIARISDVGRFDDGKPYMVMEFLQGADIGQMIDQHGFIQPMMAVDLLLQACDALAEAHSIGIIHRDVKPSNLFVTFRPDGTAILKVLDFGISKTAATDMSLTQTQSMLGTPAYMSPEQMRSARKVDARTDIWSLGSVLYEAVEGHLPFLAESFSEMCVKVAVDAPTPMVRMPPELQAIVMRCLAKHPDARYPSVAELAHDLMPYSSEPHRSKLMVERMFRTLGRRGVNTPMTETSGAGIPAYMDQSIVMSGPNPVPQQAASRGTPTPTVNVGPAAPKAKWWIVAIPVVLAGMVGAAVVASTRDAGPDGAGSGSSDGSEIGAGAANSSGTAGANGGNGGGGTAKGSDLGSGGANGSDLATGANGSGDGGGTANGGTATTDTNGSGVVGGAATNGGAPGNTGASGGVTGDNGTVGANGANGTTAGAGSNAKAGSNAAGTGGRTTGSNATVGTTGRNTGGTGRTTGSGRPQTGSGSAKTVPATGSGTTPPSQGSAKPCDPFTSRTACK